MSNWITIITVVFLCAPRPALADEVVDAEDAAPTLSTPSYMVGPGDILNIVVYDEPDLSGKCPVGDSGHISVPLVGPVSVAGLSLQEVDAELTRILAAGYLVNPYVTVEVEQYGSKSVRVLGAVMEPGVFYLRGDTRLLDVLAEAGGLNNEKSADEIKVKRDLPDGSSQTITVSEDDLMGRGENNLVLLNGDVVYVPEGLLVYVTGQVQKAGPITFSEGLTLTQAINAAGGTVEGANTRKISLLRDGQHTEVALKAILKGTAEDIMLRPGDQLFIEQSIW
jgi:polysaccharide export outer membrane protein